MAAMAARMGPPFSWSLSLLTGGLFPERPGAVKGAPLLNAAKRTLDGEDRSATIQKEGKAPDSGREVDPKKWPLRSPPLTHGYREHSPAFQIHQITQPGDTR